jgi:protocatechuate 3,4-dioxygenase beta subunit
MFTGTVTGLTCGRIAGARVDVWHADPAGRYEPARYRGHQLTDADGRFAFRTIVPGAPPGRAPHLGLNVVVAGKADFWTELFFPNDPRNTSDPRFRDALLLTVLPSRGGTTASFDVILEV